MRDDLDSRLGELAARARDLLLPLAYAQGTGLPWEDVWPLLARTLTRTPCTSADLDWLIEEAGYYIVESTSEDGRRSVYRLYHEALAEHLRAGRDDPTADQAAIVDALTGHTPRLGRWPHRLGCLPTHIPGPTSPPMPPRTDRLDPLLTDPRFLLAAAPLSAAGRPAISTNRSRARLRRCLPQSRRPASCVPKPGPPRLPATRRPVRAS